MGAEENAVDAGDDNQIFDLIEVVEKLDRGYQLVWTPDSQLALIAPSPVDPLDGGTAAA